MSILGKLSFKDQAFRLREDAILDACTRILVSKGFDLMTMDDVANEVGISKPSLYKHFKSKDDLACEAMVRLLDGAQEFLDQLPASHDGRQVFDGLSGLWCTGLGHGRPEIVEAIARQAATLDYSPGFQFGHPVSFALANKIVERMPEGLNRVDRKSVV